MSERAPLLQVKDLSVSYQGRNGYPVVEDVSFDVFEGETVGIVGESGCGKSTMARAIMRLNELQHGEVVLEGRGLGSLKGEQLRAARRDFQMVFQDPFGSLDSRMTVRALVEQPLHTHGIGEPGERRRLAEDVLTRLGLGESYWERKPTALSGGQRQRVAIARALVLTPRITVLDEPISALDVSVQAQVLNLLRDEQRRLGLTYVFIVHDLAAAEYFCDRIVVLYLGKVVETGTSEELFSNPQHPYTTALLSAAPQPGRSTKDRIVLRDEPQAKRPAKGCPFASRCPIGADRPECHENRPELLPTANGGRVACHYPGELALATRGAAA